MYLIVGNILAVVVVLLFATRSELTLEMLQKRATSPSDEPLILTPFIRNGQISEARTQSRVPSVSGMNLESYSGYFTVREKGDANLFFWFFPALNDSANKPLVLWMNGGPGLTSMYGNFGAIGPYFVTADGKLNHRNVTWLSEFNVLFIDTPVGTGFSYAESVDYYTNTSSLIAQDLTVALEQFFKVFSTFQKNDFYIAGESYAAKYAIVIADTITTNKTTEMNFKGLILVSGMFDPVNMLKPAEYLYQTAIIDKNLKSELTVIQNIFVILARLRLYKMASYIFAFLMGGGASTSGNTDDNDNNLLEKASGIISSDNILYDNRKEWFDNYIPFVNSTPVRQALHVGTKPFNQFPSIITTGLTETGDLATPFVNELQDVLNRGHKTILVSGNMDYLVPTAVVTDTIDSLVWTHAAQYARTSRIVWKVNADDRNSAGYVTCAVNLCFVIVRDAGHTVSADEPLRALAAVERFVNNKPFNG